MQTALQGRSSTVLIIVALLAGAIIGFAGSTLSYRHNLLERPGEGPFQRMSRELKLTPDQREEMRVIIDTTRDRITDARRDFEHSRRKLLVDAYVRIRAVLKPEQQQLLDHNFVPPALREAAQSQDAADARSSFSATTQMTPATVSSPAIVATPTASPT